MGIADDLLQDARKLRRELEQKLRTAKGRDRKDLQAALNEAKRQEKEAKRYV